MTSYKTMECCALGELSGLSDNIGDPAAALREVFTNPDYYSTRVDESALAHGAFIFTEAAKGTYGKALKQFIEKNNLGKVTALPSILNPNTDNRVRTFFWKPYRRNLVRWINKELNTI